MNTRKNVAPVVVIHQTLQGLIPDPVTKELPAPVEMLWCKTENIAEGMSSVASATAQMYTTDRWFRVIGVTVTIE